MISEKKILLVDDHEVVRTGLRLMLEKHDSYVIQEAATAEAANLLYRDFNPDVVIMDIMMPGMGGLEGVRHIKVRDANARVLVVSMRDDSTFVKRALLSGCLGYVTKRSAPDELTKALEYSLKGIQYISEDVLLSKKKKGTLSDEKVINSFTRKEFEIFCKLTEGKKTLAISNELHMSPKTVSNYRTVIMRKASATSIVDLVRMSIRAGIHLEQA